MSKHSSRGAAWEATRLAVLRRDGWTCQYCGKRDLEGRDATVDHIIAKSQGGDDSMANLVTSCFLDNRRKSDKPLLRIAWFDPDLFPNRALAISLQSAV